MQNLTGYPSIDLPQSQNATYFEKNPVIPGMCLKNISENQTKPPVQSLREREKFSSVRVHWDLLMKMAILPQRTENQDFTLGVPGIKFI